MSLLSYPSFAKFEASTALSILDATVPRSSTKTATAATTPSTISADDLSPLLSPFDMKRLESYCSGMLEHHVIVDLVPLLAQLYFGRRMGDCTLSAAQQAILLALGLQRKTVDALEIELGLGGSQALALFGKIVRRLTKFLEDVRKEGAGRDVPREGTNGGGDGEGADSNGENTSAGAGAGAGASASGSGSGSRKRFEALDETVEQELASGAKEVSDEVRRQRAVQKEILGGLDMKQ